MQLRILWPPEIACHLEGDNTMKGFSFFCTLFSLLFPIDQAIYDVAITYKQDAMLFDWNMTSMCQ